MMASSGGRDVHSSTVCDTVPPVRERGAVSIWVWAFGYFATYAPYSLLTKAVSDGLLGPKVPGNMILPLSTLSSVVVAFVFLFATGWWRSATRWRLGGHDWPRPTRWTALSGLCGATILTTTTLAYTFEGVSIVFMMLLMRGGVLIMAPLVDAISRRTVRLESWVALGLTMLSLLVAMVGRVDGARISVVAAVNVAAYLGAYFVRLQFMSRLAKSDSVDATRRYFVEEQLVSTPVAFAALGVLALIGGPGRLGQIREGFTTLPFDSMWPWAVLIGVLSQGVGVFGALVLLDKRENSFSVPVNRASSVLAGVVATLTLWLVWHGPALDLAEGIAAALVVLAIVMLSLPTLKAKKVEVKPDMQGR